ncbi:T9SS type B sorting domain-containing protein [uncultured Flavobacterium sp.]|uniref:T9SS type B sorting domain-containing protein n=1 Tax=uncultured Flavobacterium sp. TaxID=165435 RepID=UPI0025D3E2B0|nr:T9SS type B sorting domain-containing protein [uncultured Flavobacterium sp.]
MITNQKINYRQMPVLWLCRYFIIAGVLFCFAPAAAQLSLNVAVTDEVCPGSGSLLFTVDNADPAAPINYKVYALPNSTTPISNNANTSVTGLIAGSYLVVATQVVGGMPVTDQEEVSVADLTVALTYSIASENAYCGPDGTISVTVITGTGATYEILQGPVTRPAQASNIFSNLPPGNYQVRVTDSCGSAEVTTHILFSDGPILAIDQPAFPDLILPACGLITTENNITSSNGIAISYPLTATFTIFPPGGGAPVTYNQTIAGGGEQAAIATQVIPFYHDIPYHYELVVTDPCGTVYSSTNPVNQHLNALPGFDDLGCGNKAFMITVTKYVPPYNVTFTSVPAGFDPEMMNTAHPGPFNENIIYYGDEENPVPAGIYAYSVTDACGHTTTNETELLEPEIEPIASPFAADCLNNPGKVEISIPGYYIGAGMITVGPPEYEEAFGVPNDVSEFIDEEGILKVNGLFPGEYAVTVTDTCGTVWPEIHFEILQSPGGVGNPLGRPDCTPGRATVYMSANGGMLTMVKIMTAPPGFALPLPYDATANISGIDGAFYMDSLPPGPYTFLVDTTCETGVTKTASLTAYSVTANEFDMTRHCGSFDFVMQHTGNAIAFLSYWLQKYDPATDTWGHPDTGVSATAGNAPVDAENGMQVDSNVPEYNLSHTGQFRIVKIFQSFPNGSEGSKKYCMEILQEFEFLDDLQITGIMSLTCSGAIGDVQVNVEGVLPLTYELISKNGDDTFYLSNGQNNVFNALDTAFYKVRVADPCGNFKTEIFNVADLPSLVTATQPDDLHLCDTDGNGTEPFDLNQQSSAILSGQDPVLVALTYHSSQADADSGAAPLAGTIESGTATIYARLVYGNNTACIATTSFTINVHQAPVLLMQDTWTVCEGEEIEVVADSGFDSYMWSGGEGTQSIRVSENGSHTVTVTNQYGCETEKTISVVVSPLPVVSHIEIGDWTDNDNTISVIMQNPSSGSFEYSLDGVHYQASPVFSGLIPGPYVVYVRDEFECGLVALPAFVLSYPKFFTPNGDGINETWRIRFSVMEPEMLVYIYDRFGKLITGFGADSTGWDGTLNGTPLPATDYWFVVKRQNGEEMKGHFSMIR